MMKESKKSLLMLVALFMLGACSTNNSNSDSPQPHETWAEELGGKYAYATVGNNVGLIKIKYLFSADASRVYEDTTGMTYNIQSGSTVSSAGYDIDESSGLYYYVIFYDFDSDSGSGKILVKESNIGEGTFNLTGWTD